MKEYEKKQIQKILYDRLLKEQEEEIKMEKIENEKSFREKLHLYIDSFFNFVTKLTDRRLGKLFSLNISAVYKKKLEGLIDVCANIVGYGLIGALALSLLLLIFPSTNPTPIVEILRNVLWIEIVVFVLGSGSVLYLISDFSIFYAELKNKKRNNE